MSSTGVHTESEMVREDRQRRYVTIMWVILAIAAVLRVAFICHTAGSDDLRYFDFADRLFHGTTYSHLDHAAGRIAFLVLVGFPGIAFGSIVWSGVASILFAIGTDIVTCLFVLRVYGSRAACVAACISGLAGVSLAYAGALLPDAALTLFFALVGINLYSALSGGKSPRWSAFFLTGVYIGIAYSIKDTGILLLPPVGLYLLTVPTRESLRNRITFIITVGLGFLAVWVAESLVMLLYSGDFLYQIHSLSEVHNAGMDKAQSLYEFVHHGFWNLAVVWRDWDFLLLPSLGGLLAALFVMRKWKAQTIFGLIILFCGGYLFFGTSSFSRLINLPFQDRYMNPLLPLIAISIAAVFHHFSRAIRALITIGVILSAGLSIYGSLERVGDRYFEGYLKNVSEGAVVVEGMGGHFYTDQRTKDGLRHVMTGPEWQGVEVVPDSGILTPGYYVLHPSSNLDDARVREIDSIPTAFVIRKDRRLLAELFPGSAQPARFEVDFRLLK